MADLVGKALIGSTGVGMDTIQMHNEMKNNTVRRVCDVETGAV